MKVLVDTCVWSHALRHKVPDKKIIKKLTDLINDGRVVIVGPIRQELLSGIPRPNQFDKIRDILITFEEIPLESDLFDKAAEFCNICRSKGIQGSTIDFLICATAFKNNLAIYTIDDDFTNFAKYIPIQLIK